MGARWESKYLITSKRYPWIFAFLIPLGVLLQLEQLQNTPQLIYMSLNKNSVYCVMPRSSKPPDTCKWGGHELQGILRVLTRGKSAAIMVNLTYVVLLGGRRGMLKKFSFAVERDRLSMRGKKRIWLATLGSCNIHVAYIYFVWPWK